MDLLVTGTSASTTSSRRVSTFASLLTWAVSRERSFDFDVTQDRPSSFALSEADAVLVGVSSPTAPVSNYSYSGFALIAEAHKSGRLVGMFLDQPSPGSVFSGCKTVLDDYSRLSSSFYSKRPEYDRYVSDSAFASQVRDGVRLVLSGDVPLLLPLYPWADVEKVSQKIGVPSERVVPIDLTTASLDFGDVISDHVRSRNPRSSLFVAETRYRQKIQVANYTDIPLTTVKSTTRSAAFDSYARALAVLEGDLPTRGWWTPTASAALSMGSVFVGGPVSSGDFASPWLDEIVPDEQPRLASDQLSHLRKVTWSWDTLVAQLNSLISARSPLPSL